jgi:translation initiation factor IF-3
MSKEDALRKAIEEDLDLVEISPKAEPPVAKIIDFGKFKYDQKRAEKKNKQKQKKGDVKEIRFSLKISDHDLEVKAKRAEKFLTSGHKVNLMLRFKGREITHKELGEKVVKRVIERLSELGKPEGDIKLQGMVINLVISPK